jgi:hypothetical protein
VEINSCQYENGGGWGEEETSYNCQRETIKGKSEIVQTYIFYGKPAVTVLVIKQLTRQYIFSEKIPKSNRIFEIF